MKLASLKDGRNGRLVVVSTDLAWCAEARHIVPTLQAALDDWSVVEPSLRNLATDLEHGAIPRNRFHEREAAAARERLRELGAAAAPPLPELTPREREVLALLAEGLTNRLIAERLVVSEHTVHRHVTSILRKLSVGDRTQTAVYALQHVLARLPDTSPPLTRRPAL